MLATAPALVPALFQCIAGSITVSGYPPVAATRVLLAHRLLATVTASEDIGRVTLPPVQPGRTQCSGCNKPAVMDPELEGFCAECAPHWKAESIAEYGRLPGAEEFWCTAGQHIAARADKAPNDPTHGRQRRQCNACRNGRIVEAWRRRRANGR